MKSLVRWSAILGLVGSTLSRLLLTKICGASIDREQVFKSCALYLSLLSLMHKGHHWLPLFQMGKTRLRQWQAFLSARRTLRLLLSD
jgi:hypothetical protein